MAVGRVLAGILGALALSSPVAFADEELFVSNYYGSSINVYQRTASGDVAPLRTIHTGLSQPHDLGIDLLRKELFVPNNLTSGQSPAINVYDLVEGLPGIGDTPKRTITGAATLLDRPAGIAVDSVHQELYVANDVNSNAPILVFALGANGNAAPIRVLQGPLTTLVGPIGVALDLLHNELIVVSYKVSDEGSITVFPRTAQGNVAPLRTIQGPLTGFNRPQAVALDLAHNELILANSFFDSTASLGGVLVFSRTATGNVAPIRQIAGPSTGMCNPIGLVLDRVNDQVLVTNSGASGCPPSVGVFARAASGNVAPLRTVGPGPLCGLNNPEGIAVTTTTDCADPLVANGTSCSDGNACTTGDTCSGGVCTGGPTVCGCASNAACADGNPCTDDACQNPGTPQSSCTHTNNTASCNDNNVCTNPDTCSGGTCFGGPNVCACTTDAECADANSCTVDVCQNSGTPQAVCVHTNNTAPCNDGNACTTGDACAGGSCNPGTPVACDDGNFCTTDSCSPASGCVFTNNSDPCDDNNACTNPDTCVNGDCVGGQNVCACTTDAECADTNPCTDDACENPGTPQAVCAHTNNTVPCDDNNACTAGDACGGGACNGGTPITGPPELQNLAVAADKATFSWSVETSSTQYDVVRGSIGAFPVGPGGAAEVCFDNLAGPSLNDAIDPDPDTGFWYLSRGENACGTGTYGTESDGSPRITTTCP